MSELLILLEAAHRDRLRQVMDEQGKRVSNPTVPGTPVRSWCGKVVEACQFQQDGVQAMEIPDGAEVRYIESMPTYSVRSHRAINSSISESL